MNLPHHRLTMREQNERDALRRNRDFTYLLAVAVGCAIFFLVWSVHS